VELEYCEHISQTEVVQVLKKNELKPHLKRTWCIGKLDSRFLVRMEQILELYAMSYEPFYPVVCFDERACFLIGDEALALAERFDFHFTAKSASWLNMIEIEFSALARQCLHCRILTIAQLERGILALVEERSSKHIKIDWQFSIQSARSELNSHYAAVHLDNIKFSES